MRVVATPPPDGHRRTTPVALLFVGMPAYLVVVGFSVADIVGSHSPPVAALAVAAVVVFSALFTWLALVYRRPGDERLRRWVILAMAVLAGGLALLGTTSSVYLIVVAAMAGDNLQPRTATAVILLATAAVAVYSIVADFAPQDVLTNSTVTFVVGLFAFGVARLSEANNQLAAAREEVARLAVVDERLRFARDLHDLLGHSLTVVRAKSELASRLAHVDPSRAAQEMSEVEGLARQALAEVREAVTGYRRSSLAAELVNARTALDAAGIAVEVAVDGLDVPPDVDEALGWVLREAVTNVVRHSGAGRCRVEAGGEDDGDVRLVVADDGNGAPAGGSDGSGLTGVRERLAAVGGTLEVGRADGGGFRLLARVPRPA
jgi:two-component system sensor histidine kinase DesK